MNPANCTSATRDNDLRSQLARLGDARDSRRWHEGARDYVSELGLSQTDVPTLLAVAREWFERTEWPEDPDDTTVHGSIHAWRAAGQLRAEDAVDTLLDILASQAVEDDDWYLEEFPHVFGLIGPGTIDRVAAFARDASHAEFPRVAAAHALAEIARRHPDSRPRVLEILTSALTAYDAQTSQFNAFLVCYLLDIRATEAAELIERAFADNRVDVSVVGNWNDVRTELGVEDHGIVPKRLAVAKPDWAFGPEAGERIGDDAEHAPGAPSAQSQRGRKRRKRKSR